MVLTQSYFVYPAPCKDVVKQRHSIVAIKKKQNHFLCYLVKMKYFVKDYE